MTATVSVLVTGYEPFGGRDVNPSQQVVEALACRDIPGVTLHTAVLPVAYDVCVDVVLAEMARVRPDAVIACGLAAGRTAVTPERIAVNVKGTSTDPSSCDNAGDHRIDEPISDGPDGLFSTLPVREIQRAIAAAGIPSAVSDTAGTFICNNTMYGILDHLRREGSSTPAGFLHLPASSEMAAIDPALPSLPLASLPLATLERAVRIAVETVAAGLRS